MNNEVNRAIKAKNGSLYITDPEGENIQPQGCMQGFWIIIGAVVLTVLLCLLFPSCKSVQASEKVNVRDSVEIRWHDSIRWNIRDSLHIIEHHVTVKDSTGLTIQFGQGGGTYNSKTGEATNVAGVHQTDTHHEQRDSISHYRTLASYYAQRSDSIANRYNALQTEYEKVSKQTRTGYDRFCSWWFWITAILLLIKLAAWVMEKFPTTAPYILIARKFVPFL